MKFVSNKALLKILFSHTIIHKCPKKRQEAIKKAEQMWKVNFTALKETADKLQSMSPHELKSAAISDNSSAIHEGGSQDNESANDVDIHNLLDPSEKEPSVNNLSEKPKDEEDTLQR